MATLEMEMDSIVATLQRHLPPGKRFFLVELQNVTMDGETSDFNLSLTRQQSSNDQLKVVLSIVRNKERLGPLPLQMLNSIEYPGRVDGVKFKWFWSIILNSFTIWVSICEYFDIEVDDFNSWAESTFAAYNDDELIDSLQGRLANELFIAWGSKLRGRIVDVSTMNGVTRGRATASMLSSDSNEPPQKRKTGSFAKASNKSRISHMPDVWGYSDTYFELQSSIQDRILDYLVFMGYDDVVKTFLSETLNVSESTTNKQVMETDTSTNTRVNLDTLFQNWGVETQTPSKIDMIHDIDIEEVTIRKTIKYLILSGSVEEALTVIEDKFPAVLTRFPSMKFRLRHLELVERIKAYLESDDEIEEEQFLTETMAFVKQYLTDREILQDSTLLQQMEDTMTLLCVCKRGDPIPERFQEIVSNSMRQDVARTTNDSLWSYNFGERSDSISDMTRLMAWSFGSKMSLKHTASIMLREKPGHAG